MTNGTKLGWLIDPGEQSVLVYFPQQQPVFIQDAAEVLPVPDFAQNFQLTLAELFGWLFE